MRERLVQSHYIGASTCKFQKENITSKAALDWFIVNMLEHQHRNIDFDCLLYFSFIKPRGQYNIKSNKVVIQ